MKQRAPISKAGKLSQLSNWAHFISKRPREWLQKIEFRIKFDERKLIWKKWWDKISIKKIKNLIEKSLLRKNYKPWIWGNCKFYRLWWVVSAAINFCNLPKKMRRENFFQFFSPIYSRYNWQNLSLLRRGKNIKFIWFLDWIYNIEKLQMLPLVYGQHTLAAVYNPQKKIFFMMHKCSLSHPHLALKLTLSFAFLPNVHLPTTKHIFYYKFMQKSAPRRKKGKSFSFLLNVVIFMCNW